MKYKISNHAENQEIALDVPIDKLTVINNNKSNKNNKKKSRNCFVKADNDDEYPQSNYLPTAKEIEFYRHRIKETKNL